MKSASNELGDVGMTVQLCDNPACRKKLVLAWKGREGEYCTQTCLKAVEEKSMTEDESTQDTAAPAAKKSKAKGKKAAKAPAKKKAAAKGSGNRLSGEEKITVIKKENDFRGKRVKMFALIKTGMTTKQASDAIQKFLGGARYSGFLHICKDAGLIKWAA